MRDLLMFVVNALVGISLLIACALTVMHFRIEQARKRARARLPARGEIWEQDGDQLYIVKVEERGVRLRLAIEGVLDDDQPEWFDTWEAWRARCRNRVVVRTIYRWKSAP